MAPTAGGQADIGTRRPGYSEIDVWGLTHPGKVRPKNEDHYFVGSFCSGVLAERTSIPSLVEPERLASFGMVADGVGSGGSGEEASRLAVQGLVEQVAQRFHVAYAAESRDPDAFSRLLEEAALSCHERLLARADEAGEHKRLATTMTLFLGLWPHAYLLQIGDSRCYAFRDGVLTQISRDQTMAQDLIDQGLLTRTKAANTRWAHVLSSAMGGQQAAPVVTRLVRDWGTVTVLCSDGLTKHVSDDRIAERLSTMTSAKQVCEDLLQDALDDGGSDNITIIVGRTLRPADA